MHGCRESAAASATAAACLKRFSGVSQRRNSALCLCQMRRKRLIRPTNSCKFNILQKSCRPNKRSASGNFLVTFSPGLFLSLPPESSPPPQFSPALVRSSCAYIDAYAATVCPAPGKKLCPRHHQHAACFQALIELLGRNGQILKPKPEENGSFWFMN